MTLRLARSSVDDRQRERLEYAFELAANTDNPSVVQVGYEIATPRGDLVTSSAGQPARLSGRSQSHTGTVWLPADLDDGYFVVRAIGAGADGETSSAMLAEEYVVVRDGRPSPVSIEEWHANSGINLAEVISSTRRPTSVEEARALYGAPTTNP